MGFSELESLYEVEKKINNKHYLRFGKININAMFDDDEEQIKKYHSLIVDSYNKADLIANWYSCKMEGDLIKKYSKNSILVPSKVLEPRLLKKPWSMALEGKKVLVIHPFTKTIVSQYKKRELLFDNKLFLPNFELKVIPSVWYDPFDMDRKFITWFDALNYLKEEIRKTQFDIALLGCGPFGVPLVTYIKDIGKQAIYIGGALQIMFGIKGARWDQIKEVRDLYNEHWVRPDEEFKPNKYDKIDGGCYW